MGLYESKNVNIMPGRTGSVFGTSKLLLDRGSLKKISVMIPIQYFNSKLFNLRFLGLIPFKNVSKVSLIHS